MKKAQFIKNYDKIYFFRLLEAPDKDKEITLRKYKPGVINEELLEKLVPEQEVLIAYFWMDIFCYLFAILPREPKWVEEMICKISLQCEMNKLKIEQIRDKNLPKLQGGLEEILSKKQDNRLIKHTNLLILITLVVIMGYLLIK